MFNDIRYVLIPERNVSHSLKIKDFQITHTIITASIQIFVKCNYIFQ